jgi:hypothetical protein
MPFRIRHRTKKGELEPNLIPTPVCDFCGQAIAHVRDGVWLLHPELYEAADTPLLVAHHDRTDDQGDPVMRCHYRLEATELAAGRHAPGWLELGDLVAYFVVGFPGARQRAAEALELHERDVWLLRWLAAGMPKEPLPGQPKEWDFEPGDASRLADRLAGSVARGTPTSETDDDFKYGQIGRDRSDSAQQDKNPDDEDEGIW